VPKPNPGKTGDDKKKHGNNENISSDPERPYDAANAYVHVQVKVAETRSNHLYHL
jgi:hypothetical protein